MKIVTKIKNSDFNFCIKIMINMCRLCLAKKSVRNIFEVHKSILISTKIMAVAEVEVSCLLVTFLLLLFITIIWEILSLAGMHCNVQCWQVFYVRK